MAKFIPTSAPSDIFSEETFNSSGHGLTTTMEEGDMSVYNVTVPWSEIDPPTNVESCSIFAEYSIGGSLVAIVCFIFGVLYTLCGYRFFKAVLFLTGFLLATVLLYMLLEEQGDLLPPEGTLACAVGAGILLGLLSMLVTHVGLVLTGFSIGAAAAAAIMVLVEQFVHPSTRWIPAGVFLALGIVFGILGLKHPKAVTISGTSVIGSAVGLAGVDYFVERSRASLYLWDRLMASDSPRMCWFSWLVLAIWPALSLLGVLVQWRCTAAGVDHHAALRGSPSEQSAPLQEDKAREGRDTQQTRYRHLYQARRVRGDVISQSYIQSIQHKLSPAMQSLTALNVEANPDEDSTATTTLTQVT